MSNRDIVPQVVYVQILDMGLATPVSVSCHQGRGETVELYISDILVLHSSRSLAGKHQHPVPNIRGNKLASQC